MMGYGYGYPEMWSPGFGIVGGLFMLIWLVVLLMAIGALVRYVRGTPFRFTAGSTALDILKERYAKGEVDKAEFEEKRKDLS